MKVFLCTVLLVGCAFAAPDLRIVGGEDATPNEFPYMISLQKIEVVQGRSKHFCGGSIISDRWILTAAHCVDGSRFIEETQIVAGAHSLTIANAQEQIKLPKRIVKHPKYGGTPGYFDIALVELKQPLDFNEFVNKVKIPAGDPYYPSGAGIVSSWGSTSNTGIPEYPDILQKAAIPIVPALRCYTLQTSDDLKVHLTDLCAGPLDGSKSICLDDYGSPFVQRNIHGEFIQVGVVGASSTPCGLVDKKGILVNVSFFLEWIHNTIGTKMGC